MRNFIHTNLNAPNCTEQAETRMDVGAKPLLAPVRITGGHKHPSVFKHPSGSKHAHQPKVVFSSNFYA